MIYLKRAAMRAMTASQAQAQVAAQVIQPQADNNQQTQPTEIKDVTMSEANTENAQAEGRKVASITSPMLIPHREWHDYTVRFPNYNSVGNCCCVGPPSWCLGPHRRSEPDPEDSIPTPHPLHGDPG